MGGVPFGDNDSPSVEPLPKEPSAEKAPTTTEFTIPQMVGIAAGAAIVIALGIILIRRRR